MFVPNISGKASVRRIKSHFPSFLVKLSQSFFIFLSQNRWSVFPAFDSSPYGKYPDPCDDEYDDIEASEEGTEKQREKPYPEKRGCNGVAKLPNLSSHLSGSPFL